MEEMTRERRKGERVEGRGKWKVRGGGNQCDKHVMRGRWKESSIKTLILSLMLLTNFPICSDILMVSLLFIVVVSSYVISEHFTKLYCYYNLTCTLATPSKEMQSPP